MITFVLNLYPLPTENNLLKLGSYDVSKKHIDFVSVELI
ncbi:hypothetical protein SAMN05444397_11198 [Flavobacterium aquidurense]|nr:hypothetical protein SAMN05444397_11198 [Flavobacterium aquidurense]